MRAAGWSPSVRLFEAAACGVPVISDRWPGLDSIFQVGEEILVADSAAEAVVFLERVEEDERREIAARARHRVLAEHTAECRCDQLEHEVAGAAAR
jgi:spore maturation protein CgeB